MNFLSRLLERKGETIASFDSSDLVQHRNGQWPPLPGVGLGHQAAAREWPAPSQLEAAFSSHPLTVDGAQPQPAVDGPPKRVLIADDDPVVRCSLAAVLESERYVIDEARNGIEAVTRCIQNPPDLVLLDLNMPHWDGWTAFSQLDRVAPLLPVIVITARPNQYDKAVRLGVDAFMEKPLNFPVLVRAIGRLTTEERNQRVGRITQRAFVTELLAGADS